jgi:hypothetical protein
MQRGPASGTIVALHSVLLSLRPCKPMLIRISYLLLIATVAIAAFLLVRMTRDNADDTASFTGADRCAVCHSSSNAGRQSVIWSNSAHAAAYDALQSDSARRYLRENSGSVASCLACHTTLGREALTEAEHELVAEGVGCERCHGAGSRYAFYNIMRDRARFTANGGAAGSLDDCYQCHAANPAVADRHCPFQRSPFNADSAWAAIRHPISARGPEPDTLQELRP